MIALAGILISLLVTALLQPLDTVLAPSYVRASKIPERYELLAAPVSRIGLDELSTARVNSPKELQQLMPGLHFPEYGASLTSTIYLRGFGSRMENPVLGLYVDDIPILDKNCYDFDYLDIRSALMLRGPQGTLFGRNSMAGLLSLHTLSPRDFQGIRSGLEYGNALSLKGRLALYRGDHAFLLGVRHSDGWFPNMYTGKRCDPYNGITFRWKREPEGKGPWTRSEILSVGFSDEGGFAYGRYLDGVVHPVSYNDPAGYRRLYAIGGFKAAYSGDAVHLQTVSSVQSLFDRMRMDQDFTPESVFTLEQRQKSGAVTMEWIARPAAAMDHWDPVTGFFVFFKVNAMAAPVHFKEAGIRDLILGNANRNIPSEIGFLDIPERQFPVYSDFLILTRNAALFHESVFHFGRWHLTAGLRFDFEAGRMDYDSRADIHYQFLPFMTAAKAFQTSYQGRIGHSYPEVLPKVSVLYNVPELEGLGSINLYATFSKGYRAGGFNTQIFSDILQSVMMNGIMKDLGVYFDREMVSVGADHTAYLPEEALNYELGLRWTAPAYLRMELNAYYMDGRNQQLTVFPPGQSIGRMMTNAGRSRSIGAECQATVRADRFSSRLSYAWNRAEFLEYYDGNQDYAGNRVPYTPEHLLYLSAEYRIPLSWKRFRTLAFEADLRGTGPLWWDEGNTLREPFYLQCGGRISLAADRFDIYIQGDNLTGTTYRSFYFKSIGNAFFQASKPARASIGINFKISS